MTAQKTRPTTSQDATNLLQRLEATMQRRWFALVQAEDRCQSTSVLERLFASYMSALESYVAASRAAYPPMKRQHVA